MRRTWILKDRSAQPVGYMQQGQGITRCRLTGAKQQEAYTLWRFLQSGECRCEMLRMGGEEQVLRGDEALLGAVLTLGEVVIAETGKDARRLYAEQQTLREEQEKLVCPMQARETKTAVYAETERVYAEAPMRRWPPPACCPKAEYADGNWRLDGEISSARFF